jgi:hypothetical protein
MGHPSPNKLGMSEPRPSVSIRVITFSVENSLRNGELNLVPPSDESRSAYPTTSNEIGFGTLFPLAPSRPSR